MPARHWPLLSLALVAACQTPSAVAPPSAFVGFFANLKDCRSQYEEIDARVDAAGVRDGAFYRVPGYPYLRTDRLLASFAHEVQSIDEIGGWVRRMRELDQESREFEYMNLGLSKQDAANRRYELQACGRGLAGLELDNAKVFEDLRQRVQPPDDYSTVARAAGLYPLTAGLLKSLANREEHEARAQFGAPFNGMADVRLWTAKTVEDPAKVPKDFNALPPDELGIPGLYDSAWIALVERFAPPLVIEEGGALATPIWEDQRISADPARPEVHYHIDFVRFGPQALVRVNYFFWFKTDADADAAALDGIIWRVTLDRQAQPLLFESLHASGRDHYWFPVQALAQRNLDSYWAQPPFFPRDGLAPTAPALRLAANRYRHTGLLRPDEVSNVQRREYTLHRYENLYALPRADGSTRSLFRPDGLVHGSRSTGPSWLWISGLSQPGALRQYGHHGTSYVGRRQFDDPYLMEQVFVSAPFKQPDDQRAGPLPSDPPTSLPSDAVHRSHDRRSS